MKCHKHPGAWAAGICIHCGRALCSRCGVRSGTREVVCSTACGKSLFEERRVLVSFGRMLTWLFDVQAWLIIVSGGLFLVLASLLALRGMWLVALYVFVPSAMLIGVGAWIKRDTWQFRFRRLSRRT